MIRQLVILLSAIFVAWILGFGYYLYYIQSYRIDSLAITDAIVVYTGGKGRIETGINLLKGTYAPILFISGVQSPAALTKSLAEYKVASQQVIYGLEASTTEGNAKEIAEFIASYNLSSICLVTSNYHMPRAIFETLKLVRAEMIIIPYPVSYGPPNYRLLFKEYHKLLAVRILHYTNLLL